MVHERKKKKAPVGRRDEVAASLSDSESDEGSFMGDFEEMKKNDPEFFKFLEKEDSELLKNIEEDKEMEDIDCTNDDDIEDENDDDDDELVEEDELVEDEEEEVEDNPTFFDQEMDGDEGAASDQEEAEEEEGSLSMRDIEIWEKSLNHPAGPKTKFLRKVASAFHLVLTNPAFQPGSGEAFNRLMVLALTKLPMAFSSIFSGSAKPTSSKKWTLYHKSVRNYLKGVIELLGKITEPTILTFVLRELQNSVFLVPCFPKLVKPFIKSLLALWTGQDEQIQLFAFLALQSIASLFKNSNSSIFEVTLKLMYLEFMRRSKFHSVYTKDRIQFMLNCLLEMYSMDDGKSSYPLAFAYIRQLAMHLRNALTNLEKEKIQMVYNWQFLYCLDFWSKLLALKLNPNMDSLIYPLIQVALGTVKLQKSPQYFPFHLRVIEILNEMGRKCSIFIPVSQYLLDIVGECDSGAKKNTASKLLDLSLIVKVSKVVSQSRIFKVRVLDNNSVITHLIFILIIVGVPCVRMFGYDC